MRYQLERRIGVGGMAEVFEGTGHGDDGFRRKVAIKRLALGRGDAAAARRGFLDEARIAGALHHPAIIAVLDYGTIDGGAVQVLEWIDGCDGARLLDRATAAGRPMPVAAAVHVIERVAEALHHAHTAVGDDGAPLGIVHRDVKPSNVLIGWTGDVKLGDFGIAVAHDRLERTEAGLAKGTSGYMAPEQRAGEAVDARTDVFALGCTLHAFLTGRSAVSADAGCAIAIDPGIAAPLASVIGRATDADPAARPATARALREDVDAASQALGLGDGRRALADWLIEVRDATPRAGLLDDLLALDLQMVMASTVDEPRRFTLERGAGLAATPAPRSRRRAWVTGGLVALVVLAAALVVAFRGGSASPAAADGRASAARPSPDAGVALDAAPAPTATPTDAAPPMPLEPTPDAGPRRRRPVERTPRADAGADAPVDRPSDGAGWLAVGGAELVDGEVWVDDAYRGRAPWVREVPSGAHEVRVVLPDRVVGPVTVNVEATNDRRHPARPRF